MAMTASQRHMPRCTYLLAHHEMMFHNNVSALSKRITIDVCRIRESFVGARAIVITLAVLKFWFL